MLHLPHVTDFMPTSVEEAVLVGLVKQRKRAYSRQEYR